MGCCRRAALATEDGSSSVTSVFGVLMFLASLLLATQVLVHLWATSVVTTVAVEEARRVSATAADGSVGGGCDDRVEPRVRARLGGWGQRASVSCAPAADRPEAITVRITGPTPARSLAAIGFTPMADIDRSATFLAETPPGASGSDADPASSDTDPAMPDAVPATSDTDPP